MISMTGIKKNHRYDSSVTRGFVFTTLPRNQKSTVDSSHYWNQNKRNRKKVQMMKENIETVKERIM